MRDGSWKIEDCDYDDVKALADALPVADEVAAELAARIRDPPVGSELDEVGGLLVVQVVRPDQPEPNGGTGNSLLEVLGVEAEAVAEELDDVLVA